MEDSDESGGAAISGDVAVGTVVKTTTRLNYRRTPSQANRSNILGVLPTGTDVRIVKSSATDGFYNVSLEDAALAKVLGSKTGWVYGQYLKGNGTDTIEADGGTDAGEADAKTDVETIPTPDGATGPLCKKLAACCWQLKTAGHDTSACEAAVEKDQEIACQAMHKTYSDDGDCTK